MGLITIEYFKSLALPIKIPQYNQITDETLQTTIDEASEFVEDYTDRKFAQAQYTERIVGSDRYTVMLEQFPIVSLDSISARDIYDNTETFSTSSFLIHADAGILEWLNKSVNFFLSNRVYVITYTAGYSTIPGPVKRATALQTLELLMPVFRQSSTMQPVDFVPETSEQIVELLEKYRRKRIG